MITIRLEFLDPSLIKELNALIPRHHEESQMWTDMVLDIDWEVFLKIQERGLLAILVCRNPDDDMVGYCFLRKDQDILHKGRTVISTAGIYVNPEYRPNGVGLRLLKSAEEVARDWGGHCIYFSESPGVDLTPLLEHQGYRMFERMFEKRLQS